MRTTVTLEPDVERLIRRAMRERGLTFKAAVNEAIRAGAAPRRTAQRVEVPSLDLGEPLVDLTKANRLVAEMEDEERARRMAQGS